MCSCHGWREDGSQGAHCVGAELHQRSFSFSTIRQVRESDEGVLGRRSDEGFFLVPSLSSFKLL